MPPVLSKIFLKHQQNHYNGGTGLRVVSTRWCRTEGAILDKCGRTGGGSNGAWVLGN